MNTSRRTSRMLAVLPAMVLAMRPMEDIGPLPEIRSLKRPNPTAKVHTKNKHRRGRPKHRRRKK